MPRHADLTLDEKPLDRETILEVLGSLESMQETTISHMPRLAGNVMSDAALIIRALADKAGVDIE